MFVMAWSPAPERSGAPRNFGCTHREARADVKTISSHTCANKPGSLEYDATLLDSKELVFCLSRIAFFSRYYWTNCLRGGFRAKSLPFYEYICPQRGSDSSNGPCSLMPELCQRTFLVNTVFGTFVFQQVIYYPITTVLLTERAYHIYAVEQKTKSAFFEPTWQLNALTARASCDALKVMVHEDQRIRFGQWYTHNFQQIHQLERDTAAKRILLKTFSHIFSPVEKRRQVLLQHTLSLAAIAFLAIRAFSEFRNSYEDLPIRTIVKPCMSEEDAFSELFNAKALYMSSPGHRHVTYNALLSPKMPEQLFDINISVILEDENLIYNKIICNMEPIHTIPSDAGTVDWFGKYNCDPGSGYIFPHLEMESARPRRVGYEFSVVQRYQEIRTQMLNPSSGRHILLSDHTPSIWLGVNVAPWDFELHGLMMPYLTNPILPEFGWNTVYETHIARRRYIVSSPLMDSITGADPVSTGVTNNAADAYLNDYVWLRHISLPLFTLLVSSTELVATGLIYLPVFLESSEKLAVSGFKPGQAPRKYLCKVTEDYRVTSTFDVFASIGGLLALLQGVHILLFGRPLFWGIFGAKAITPFGIMGSLATKSFKKRLQERYHIPRQGTRVNSEQFQGGSQSRNRAGVDIDMTQFLLDYVIDMGPASVPEHEEDKHRSSNSEGGEGGVECEPLRRLGDIEGMTEVTQFQWADSGESEPASQLT
ncbi:hypothetical protein AG1IA_00001 [Rhizoctonia solani AG-1 IA]|uniref:Uncharacterized protein n=1 Tax=Thanatephorus cucumeris (strain AG1-IA) TaxID=983506 RepID=L8XBA1_THACA|nr:hypothetical protein AG1IA_00001 [Rhizoctonia solani AG-1 IA]